MNSKKILFLLPECAGYYTELCYRMGKKLKSSGHEIIFAATTPFYGNFKKVKLSEVGRIYYLNEFLKSKIERDKYKDIIVNKWSYYASFARQTYQFNKPLNGLDELRKTKFFFQTILNENEVSLLISEGVSNSFLYLAYEAASSKNIPYFGFMAARIPYHYNVHVDIAGNQVLKNRNAPEKYLLPDAVPDYMKNSQFGGLFDRSNFIFSKSFYRELIHFIFLKTFYSFEVGDSKRYFLRVYQIVFKRILADIYFRKILKIYTPKINFDIEKVYVVYPLHFYPEASTSVMAKYYDGNEYNILKNLAFSIPDNTILVVKEHKSNVGNNTKSFYKKIKQLPNVILLDPYFNLKDNLEKFDAVVTLTSTVGFEALTKGVPVYVLGEVFYQKYPGSYKINSYSQLEEKLASLKKKTIIVDENQTFDQYSKISFQGNFNYMDKNCLEDKNISLLLMPVLDYFDSNKLEIHNND